MSNPQTTETRTLSEAIGCFPESYYVSFVRENGNFQFLVRKPMAGGEFTLIGNKSPSWQMAFADIWGKM